MEAIKFLHDDIPRYTAGNIAGRVI